MEHVRNAVVGSCLALAFIAGCNRQQVPAEATGSVTVPATAAESSPANPLATSPITSTSITITTPIANASPTGPASATGAATVQATNGLSPTQLRYLLIDTYGQVGVMPGIFICDPDVYPVAHGDEQDQATKWFAVVDQTSDEFQTILLSLNLPASTTYTPVQLLQVYREHKKLNAIILENSGDTYTYNLRISQNSSTSDRSGLLIQGVINLQGAIIAVSQQSTVLTCPICLARDTRISTPLGLVAVHDLRPGMLVWSVSSSGARMAVPVQRSESRPVAAGAFIIRLQLDDGRQLTASPGHPTTDMRTLGSLQPGDPLDGSRITRIDLVVATGAETFDILPAGETGYYWADGILVGSTLAIP